MPQPESHRAERLAAAGRHRHGVEPGRLHGGREAVFVHRAPRAVDWRVACLFHKIGHVALELREQLFHVGELARLARFRGLGRHEAFGIEVIAVDQTRIQKVLEHEHRERFSRCAFERSTGAHRGAKLHNIGKVDFSCFHQLEEGIVRLDLAFESILERCTQECRLRT